MIPARGSPKTPKIMNGNPKARAHIKC